MIVTVRSAGTPPIHAGTCLKYVVGPIQFPQLVVTSRPGDPAVLGDREGRGPCDIGATYSTPRGGRFPTSESPGYHRPKEPEIELQHIEHRCFVRPRINRDSDDLHPNSSDICDAWLQALQF